MELFGYAVERRDPDSLSYKQLLFVGKNADGLPEGLAFTRESAQPQQNLYKLQFAPNCKFAHDVSNTPTYSIPERASHRILCLYKHTTKPYYNVLLDAGLVAAPTETQALVRWDIIAREFDGFEGVIGGRAIACVWNIAAIASMVLVGGVGGVDAATDDVVGAADNIDDADIFDGGVDDVGGAIGTSIFDGGVDDVGGSNAVDENTDDNTDIFGGAADAIVLHPRGAGKVHYKVDHKAELPHDAVVDNLIPKEQTECALVVGSAPVCSARDVVAKIATSVGSGAADPVGVLADAKASTGCETERCVLVALEPKLGRETVEKTIAERLKVAGPRGIALLSNDNIDKSLRQWQLKWPRFYAYNFNMRNYASQSFKNGRIIDRPDTLATVSWEDISKNHNCAGCVINADSYSGGGTHWMALFLDARVDGQWSVEFFNSSGNSPVPEWTNWLCKMKGQMEDATPPGQPKREVAIVKVARFRHQHSTTECGVYSLFYIWSRLNGVPADYWLNNPVPDQVMFEFRQHLFHDKKFENISGITTDDFWETFQKMVPRIGWEPDS